MARGTTRHPIALLVLVLASGALLGPAPLTAQEAPISLTPDDPSLEWLPCGDFIPPECQAAILRLGPEGRDSDVLFRIPANMDLPAHWHTSAERMILISGEFRIHYDGHPPLVMRAGSYAWGPPGQHHSARCADQGTCLLFVAFVDPPDGFPVDAP
jgi:quercetin dioxygenase-like cupin family protein